MNELYRLDAPGAEQRNPYCPQSTRRAPGNVPYVIDNLWEWRRPKDMPSRRHCVCASPRPEIALEMGGASDGRLFRVVVTDFRMAQIPQKDAKLHADVSGGGSLAKQLLRQLGQKWLDSPAEEKALVSPLWAPCLSQDEVEQIFALEPLATIRQSMWQAVTLWESARVVTAGGELPYPEGEVFFEAKSWELIPAEASEPSFATHPARS
jgi:hypothetical protein